VMTRGTSGKGNDSRSTPLPSTAWRAKLRIVAIKTAFFCCLVHFQHVGRTGLNRSNSGNFAKLAETPRIFREPEG
ncbi:MAG: hypothetical protein LWW92_08910, partial [Rhodocyclales bacterium]|nr:hypothetical protein [Rhodocyclales bacterium]